MHGDVVTGFVATDIWGWVLLVSVVVIAFCSVIAAVNAHKTQRDVRTLSTKTIGVLASEGESRRIAAGDSADRP